VAEDGFAVNGFVSSPGLQWQLIGARDAQGRPIYGPGFADGQPGTLYGLPLSESLNGGFDATAAKVITGDWSKAIVGIRQEMRAELFDQGVISDADGKVILNLMQQDSKAMRFTMRLGWQVANPVTPTAKVKAQRFAFAAVTPAAGA
jgi:HK97 family phage major capsid protein